MKVKTEESKCSKCQGVGSMQYKGLPVCGTCLSTFNDLLTEGYTIPFSTYVTGPGHSKLVSLWLTVERNPSLGGIKPVLDQIIAGIQANESDITVSTAASGSSTRDQKGSDDGS